MKQKRWLKRAVSGMLTAVTLLTSAISPMTVMAAEHSPKEDLAAYVSSLPKMEEVADQLDAGELVTVADYEVEIGAEIDLKNDFTGISYEKEKVKVSFYEAQNEEGEDFSTDHADSYQATYYAEPVSGCPAYRFSRTVTVKEPAAESRENLVTTEEGSGDNADESDGGEDADADSHLEQKPDEEVIRTEEEFEEALKETKGQETVDPESGVTLSEVMTEAVDQGIDLNSMDIGETVVFEMPALMAASATGSQSVSVTRGPWYEYSDYNLGSYRTAPYYVSWGGISATAYCVQPSKPGPDDGTYTITKLADSKELAKVCYYGAKASEENGFFAEKHPDFSEGKRFIITHLAAAYANGSSDWDSGTNATGRSLAMELYDYCISMPDIPDVEMSFSNANVKAYVEGNIQRTESVKFKADELQTVTFQLPKGVRLVNETTGKTSAAGADVKISGGTRFYLTAPLTQAENVAETFSTTMKGSITKDYSAYKIVTGGSSQDLALVFGEAVGDEKRVSFQVTWTKQCSVSIVKKDAETSQSLAGAVYGIYRDAAGTDLIVQMPATDGNGASSVSLEKTQDVVYLKEISVPAGYVIDTKAYNVTLNIGKTSTQTVTDQRVDAAIHLVKEDAETGSKAQGDATLAGAVYGLYARENIVHPDGKTGILYQKDALVATLTTDQNGKASVHDLYLGKYYLREITAPEGYLLDTLEHDIDCNYEGASVPTVERTAVLGDTVKKQPFQIIKAANNGNTNADLLSGAGFSAYLKSGLKVNADGSYDFASAVPVVLTADGKTEMFTDEKGYACSIPLPYGTYIVRETTTPHNYTPVDDFEVSITENKPDEPQTWRVLLDDEFEAKLKIVKKDDETKQTVLLPGTEFKIYDMDNETYVQQVTTYPTTTVHTSFFTDSNGYLILPENLKIGHYRIEEVTAPDGYTLGGSHVEIAVDSNTAYQTDPVSGDIVIEVEYENHPVKGKLTVIKTGELLFGYEEDFLYEEAVLEGAVFEVYAAEDIYTPDHQTDADGNRTVIYEKGTLVDILTTDENGEAVMENLPLGKYRVVEKEAPYGFSLHTEAQEVIFSYEDQHTPVVDQEVTFQNERQKVALIVEKQDKENGAAIEGAVFGLYNREDIAAANGEILVEADTLLQEMTSDEDGLAVCTLDLPLGQYYVKELKVPAGYVSSDEILEFDASYQGQDVQKIELKAVKENEPTTVEFTKSDITTGVELEGASLTVLDRDGNVVDAWTSVKGEPHVIKRLIVGETYTLREEFAPYGYLKATDVEFTVEDTAEIQKVEMKDEVPTGLLIINKKGEFLEKITLLDNLKGTVEHLFEYVTGNLTEVTFEVYAAEDIHAADGVSEDYYKADELVATITTDDRGIAQLGDLPLGKYYVKEKETAHGYVLDEKIRYVDLTYRDQDTPVVTFEEEWQNARQKVSVTVLKKEKDSDRMLAGGIFGLYTRNDIVGMNGEVLMEADTLIELKTTDENGQITFMADLPVDGTYYVRELYAPDGFVTTNEEQEFTFAYAGADQSVASYEFTFENEPTTVELSKTDLTTGKELPGAHLQLTDEEGAVVEEWVSTEEPHVIKELVVGKSYTLTETKPAEGYVTAESITFTVENTAEIQKHVMEDDVTKVLISKTDIAGNELPGAKLTILDAEGNVVESWTSTEEAHYIEKLPIGEYTLREESAPEGYLVAEDVKFTVEDTGEIQKVVMVDEAKPTVQTDSPKTGDNSPVDIWAGIGLLALGLFGATLALRKKNKGR